MEATPAPRDWISFEDADGSTWLFDATFLTSPWTCIYGAGCHGVLEEDAVHLQQGCCSYGAHFADKADRKSVRAAIDRLTPAHWQRQAATRAAGGPVHRNEDGDWVTRVVDGACCFNNDATFPGGGGCALHRAALEAGERPLDWKPDVCWQLPLRLEVSAESNGATVHTLREWKRRDWGEAGADFHWWCTDAPDAFRGAEPVYRALRDEIVELVGEERYGWLADHLATRPARQILPHPARRRRRPPA